MDNTTSVDVPQVSDEETLFESVGEVMKSINTWIANNNGSQARKLPVEKKNVTKKKRAAPESPDRSSVEPCTMAKKRVVQSESQTPTAAGPTKKPKVKKPDDTTLPVNPIPSNNNDEPPAKKKKKRNKKSALAASTASSDGVVKCAESKSNKVESDHAVESKVENKVENKVESKVENKVESKAESKGDNKCEGKDSAIKRRVIKLLRCKEDKVAQIELCDNRPPKKRPSLQLLKLGIRVIQPRALLPGESCILFGNVHADIASMQQVDSFISGDPAFHIFIAQAGSLLDKESGGFAVYIVNVSSNFQQISIGDIVGYLHLRSVDGSLRISVQ